MQIFFIFILKVYHGFKGLSVSAGLRYHNEDIKYFTKILQSQAVFLAVFKVVSWSGVFTSVYAPVNDKWVCLN